jgi:hypothetical protein
METDPISAAPSFCHRAPKLWEVLQLRNNFECVGRLGKVARKAALFGAAALAVAGTLVGSKPAAATPSGLTFYPSTDIYGKGVFHFDADTFFDQDIRNGSAVSSIGLQYGAGPDNDGAFGRTEFGFDVATNPFGGVNFGDRLAFNAKTQLYNNDDAQTRVVAGIWGLGSKKLFAPNVIYLTGSKNFEFGRIHLGVANSLASKGTIGTSNRTFLTAGYDKVFANNKLQFTVDYYSGKSTISAIAPGIIYYLNDRSDFQLGFVKFNNSAFRDNIYLGFDYNFGPGTDRVVDEAPATETSTAATATQ